MHHESLDNPRRKGPIRLAGIVLAFLCLGAGIAERHRSGLSRDLAMARAEHRRLLARQQVLVQQAETLREYLSQRSRATRTTERANFQRKPLA